MAVRWEDYSFEECCLSLLEAMPRLSLVELKTAKSPVPLLTFGANLDFENALPTLRWAIRRCETFKSKAIIIDNLILGGNIEKAIEELVRSDTFAFEDLIIVSHVNFCDVILPAGVVIEKTLDAACSRCLGYHSNKKMDQSGRYAKGGWRITEGVWYEPEFRIHPYLRDKNLVLQVVGRVANDADCAFLKWSIELYCESLKPSAIVIDILEAQLISSDELFLIPARFAIECPERCVVLSDMRLMTKVEMLVD